MKDLHIPSYLAGLFLGAVVLGPFWRVLDCS